MNFHFKKEFLWHPLYEYVMTVKRKYIQSYTLLNNEPCPENYNFNDWLDRVFEAWENITPKLNEKLSKIFDPLQITCYDHYVLFKYKGFIELSDDYDLGSFFELYNGLYRECRSCVFDVKNDEIALASLAKFKNYGEDDGDWSPKNIRSKYHFAHSIFITNKLDGSYQQYRYIADEDRILGSGSQALDPVESWRLAEGYKLLSDGQKELIRDYPDYTFIFEYISPKNPIVVKYDESQEGLYLLAARDVKDGKEVSFDILSDMAEEYDSKVTQWYYNATLFSVLADTDNYLSSEKEGWVVDMVDGHKNHFRCKIKTSDYVLMHKALSKNISPNAVINAIHEDRFDDFLANCPEAYRELIMQYYNTVHEYLNLYKELIDKILTKGNAECVDFWNNKKGAMLWMDKLPKVLKGRTKTKYLGQENDFLLKRQFCYKYSEITKALHNLKRFKNSMVEG